MAYPVKKIEEYNSPKMHIIKGGKSANKTTIVAIIIAILFGIILIPIILNSIDDTPSSITIPETGIDWKNPPCSPKSLSKNWKETTHPLKIEKTDDKEFTNLITKEVIEYHPYNSQGKYAPHWHRKNPLSTNRHNYYLDENGNLVRKGSKESHIYTDC